MTIEWPPGCDPEKHYASDRKKLNVSDPRTNSAFRQAGGGSIAIRKALNLPLWTQKRHTRASVEAETRKFCEDTGRRPSNRDMPCHEQWLQRQGSSLAKLCDELGLPGGRVFDRTRESIKAEVRKVFEDTGRRPSKNDMRSQDQWLRKRGSSIPKLCDELGLPRAARRRRAK